MERRLTMTVEEAAEIIGISRTSAYLCAARGELPTRRFGRRVLVLVAPFLAMLGDESGGTDETDPPVGEESAVPVERTRELAYRSAAAASATSCS